ncbi:MAG: leucine-rich repeat protein [Lachnospiraceae bacterium]|nr:leucine-rich repeat protein [Lachnospiraceae bacterium]
MANLTPEEILRGIIDGSLTALSDSGISNVAQRKLQSHTAISQVGLPQLRSIGTSTFEASGISEAVFPKLTYIPNRAFAECKSLTKVFLPGITTGASGNSLAFERCTALQVLVLGRGGDGAFARYCTSLTALDVLRQGFNLLDSFGGCTALNKIIMRWTSGVAGMPQSALNNTPFASGKAGGTVYVPQALVSDYQNATNWSAIFAQNANNQILPIEGSIYETQYADGTPIE